MAILESLREILQLLTRSRRVIAWLAVRADKNPKASPGCGYQEDSGSPRIAGLGQPMGVGTGSSGAHSVVVLHLVMPVWDSAQAEVTDAAVFPGLRCWGLLIAFTDSQENVCVL